MPLDDWKRVQSVFLSVADVSPQERAHLLDVACSGDSEMRAEVESLLESDREDDQNISSTIASEAASLIGAPIQIGDRLSAYRVVEEIGRGGMGDVYLATRDDDQFQKQVAIKVVRRGLDTADVLGRFQHERQILANLDHPYIARLLDGGTTFDGRPFFVMDYIEGQPLDVFSQAHKLDIKTRCQLFLRILDAVAYAHRNLVVHRDLKPGNIFVTGDGSPKLLDFGVAKLIASDSGPGFTAMSPARPYTPEYASPEQVHGLPVTTATDIYSLGAVLYELLTGQRAQPITTSTPSEVERVVCITEVPRPSLASPDGEPKIDSDLDNIVLMAMRKEPARRYQSVDQFAEDVRRYLKGRPVLARQDSFWYRAGKFTRRNGFEIAGGFLIIASLVIALVVTFFQSREAQSARHAAEAQRAVAEHERVRAEAGFQQAEMARAAESQQRVNADQQRDEAVVERARAEQRLTQLLSLADKTLFEIHDAVATLPGATEARRALVRTTLDYLESIEKDHGLDDRVRLALAAGYSKIAAIQGDPTHPSLGDFPDALESYRKAEARLAPLYARKQNDPDVMVRWLEVESGLAELQYRHFDRKLGIERFLGLIPIAHRLAGLLPSDPQAVKQEAAIHGRLVIALESTDSAAALYHGNQEVAIMTALTSRFPENRDLKQELGSALAAVGSSLKESGDLAHAVEDYQRSIELREQLLVGEPHSSLLQRNLLVAYGNYATVLGIPWSANLGRFAEARQFGQKSVALARELSAADPQDKTARYDLAISLARLGMVEPAPDNLQDSLKSLQASLAILDPIGKANPNSSSITIQIAMTREYAGYRLRSLGHPAAAAEQFQLALTELESMMSANPGPPVGVPQAILAEDGLAWVYASMGDRDAALRQAHHAVDRAEKYLASNPNRATSVGHLGKAYFELASIERTLGDWGGAADAAVHAASAFDTVKDAGVLAVHMPTRKRLEILTLEIASHRTQ